jgi:hypothetical protein
VILSNQSEVVPGNLTSVKQLEKTNFFHWNTFNLREWICAMNLLNFPEVVAPPPCILPHDALSPVTKKNHVARSILAIQKICHLNLAHGKNCALQSRFFPRIHENLKSSSYCLISIWFFYSSDFIHVLKEDRGYYKRKKIPISEDVLLNGTVKPNRASRKIKS